MGVDDQEEWICGREKGEGGREVGRNGEKKGGKEGGR